MKEFLESLREFATGLGCLFVGGVLFAVLFAAWVKGAVWLGTHVLPWLFVANTLVAALDILILLPLAALRATRALSGSGFVLSSFVFGATLWFWGLLITFFMWGFIGVFVGLVIMGVGVVPIGMLAAAINGEWGVVGQLLLLAFMTFGARFFGIFLASTGDAAYEAPAHY